MNSLLKYRFTKSGKNDLSVPNISATTEHLNLQTTTNIVTTYHDTNNCYPDCWDSNQVIYFTKNYPWMYFKEKKIGCTFCRDVNLNLFKKNKFSYRLNGQMQKSRQMVLI
jgi:hypothetical protein